VSDPVLTVGWSVTGERAGDIRLPPARPDVEHLVVVQGESAQGHPTRSDVRYVQLSSRGVAKSRNEVLRRARGQFLLFADDDVRFHEDGVRRLLETLRRRKQVAVVLGMAVDETGRPRKRYPRRGTRLHRWNSAKAATYEMMVRRNALLDAEVSFDERFGAGASRYLGDEYILIADAVTKGLKCRFEPIVIATHPRTSSGSGFGTTADAAARAAVFDRVFGPAAMLARLLFVARDPTRFGSVVLLIRFVTQRFPAEVPPAE